MAYPINVKTNNYRENPKRSDIQTPQAVADYIFEIVDGAIPPGIVWDIGAGNGNLSRPFVATQCYSVVRVDVKPLNQMDPYNYGETDFLQRNVYTEFCESFGMKDYEAYPSLVLCNPPFNNTGKHSRKLLPELFMDRVWEVFTPWTPLVLFAPMGMLLNQRLKSSRYQKMRDQTAELSSIMSLPLDVFEGVEFHNLVLFFNFTDKLNPHYFLDKETVKRIQNERSK